MANMSLLNQLLESAINGDNGFVGGGQGALIAPPQAPAQAVPPAGSANTFQSVLAGLLQDIPGEAAQPASQAVQPQQGPSGVRKMLSDFVGGFSGRVGASESEAFMRAGLPNLRGIPKENINAVLADPSRKANVQAIEENIQDRPANRLLKLAQVKKALADAAISSRIAGAKDNDELLKLLKEYNAAQKQTGFESIGKSPEIQETNELLAQALGEESKKKLGIKPKPAKAGVQYSATATDARGNTIGYNPKTKKWELVK